MSMKHEPHKTREVGLFYGADAGTDMPRVLYLSVLFVEALTIDNIYS